jgi:hypothetical protein
MSMKWMREGLLLSLACGPVVLGCDPMIEEGDVIDDDDDDAIEGEEDEPGEDEPGGGGGEPDPGHDGDVDEPPGTLTAFAIRHGDLFDVEVGDEGGDSGGGGGGPEIDPDSLYVTITNGAARCEDPFAANACGSLWSVSFTLPPALQQPGVYALWPDLGGGFTVTGEPYPEGDCAWGGGTLEGTIEIVEIADGVVRGSIRDAWAPDFDPNLAFEADPCG